MWSTISHRVVGGGAIAAMFAVTEISELSTVPSFLRVHAFWSQVASTIIGPGVLKIQ